MSENVVVYFLRLENARGSSGCLEPARPLLPFMTAREDGRRVKGEGRSLPQFIGATNYGYYKLWVLRLWQQGSAPGVAIPETGKSKALFFEDSVRQTPQPVQRLVSLTDNEVSYLDWVAGLCPVLAPRDGSSH